MPKTQVTMHRWKGKWITEKMYNKRKQLSERYSVSKMSRENVKNEEDENTSNVVEKIKEAEIVTKANDEKVIIRPLEIQTVYYQNPSEELDTEESTQENKVVEGRRVVDLVELGKRLWCGTCKEALSLSNMEKECRRGLGSLLLVRCHKCLIVNEVITGKMHAINADSRAQRFDVNTDLALALLNSGNSLNSVNRLLGYLKIPGINPYTYKKYEAEIGEEEIAAIKARRNRTAAILEEES